MPVVVSGFEPVELMAGVAALRPAAGGGARRRVANAYGRVVRQEGNPGPSPAGAVFEVVDRPWRGLGVIPAGGLALRPAYAAAWRPARFPAAAARAAPACGGAAGAGAAEPQHPPVCIAGQILRGARRPCDCPAFGSGCTPEHPLGAPMVSCEGACAAYHRYRPG